VSNGNVDSPGAERASGLDPVAVAEWLARQRWYATKSRQIATIDFAQTIALESDSPVVLVLAQTGFATGTHELYQLPLCFISADELGTREPIQRGDGWVAVDAVADPELGRELLRAIDDERTIETDEGSARFHRVGTGGPLRHDAAVRPMGVEQSNSSIVFADETVLKVFRRLEPGINPELEMLRFLTEHEFASIAPLQGYYEYESRSLQATLGVAQRFVSGAVSGWELALERIGTDPAAFLISLGALGQVTAALHNALASDHENPAFAPEEPSQEALALLVATLDEEIDRVFLRLPDDERVATLAGRGQDVREQIAHRAQLGIGGRLIRTHGDFHLGQTLHVDRPTHSWLIIDFEGEPARPLFERRQKNSPLRDVAGMLRSFAYASSASAIQRSMPAPGDFERRAQETFLEHYLAEIDSALLPAGDAAILNLLSIFELEKAIYELQYELDNRPDWLSIPVAGITRLLDETA
jgi:trehalose synthase-fused probable maltokinase